MSDGAGPAPGAGAYVCGHDARELDRLALQARIYEAVTRRLLAHAGIGAGWRVVDLGCGGGDVSLLAAEAIGPTGVVVGVDRSADATALAASRARAAGHHHARFIVADLDTWSPDALVDAVIGRFVLMHQPDPVITLARARRWVKPGGVVAFVESDNASCRPGRHSRPHSPLYDGIVRVWLGALTAAGAHLDMGTRLAACFEAAGLHGPRVDVDEYRSGDPASPIFRFAAESLRSLRPRAEAAGVPVPTPRAVNYLEGALRAEVTKAGGTLAAPPAYAVWARVPGLM